ncbi:MAG: WbqC family protein [Muribaculaceae bacterium]|nr:WbqC family protein [Muribaculaceae bacterium]
MLEKNKPIIMGSMAAGSVRCYAAMLQAGKVIVDPDERRLPLRHSHHRYLVEGPNGVQRLTIALEGRTNAMPVAMKDVRISEHGNWRHLHWGALYSAYGKSPYFDYIADDLQAIIAGNQTSLLEFNTQLQNLIIDFLDLPIEIETHSIDADTLATATDLRGKIAGKKPDTLPIADVPYYQVWATRHGFQPGLSILDLLMSTGRESIYTLIKMLK